MQRIDAIEQRLEQLESLERRVASLETALNSRDDMWGIPDGWRRENRILQGPRATIKPSSDDEGKWIGYYEGRAILGTVEGPSGPIYFPSERAALDAMLAFIKEREVLLAEQLRPASVAPSVDKSEPHKTLASVRSTLAMGLQVAAHLDEWQDIAKVCIGCIDMHHPKVAAEPSLPPAPETSGAAIPMLACPKCGHAGFRRGYHPACLLTCGGCLERVRFDELVPRAPGDVASEFDHQAHIGEVS